MSSRPDPCKSMQKGDFRCLFGTGFVPLYAMSGGVVTWETGFLGAVPCLRWISDGKESPSIQSFHSSHMGSATPALEGAVDEGKTTCKPNVLLCT